MYENELPTSMLSKVIELQTDRQACATELYHAASLSQKFTRKNPSPI